MQNSVRLPAFAKINLCLHIVGRRPDGYHELRTIFQAISLHDTLVLSRTGNKPGISLEVTDSDLSSGPDNLVWRAVDAMRRELKIRYGIHAQLTKRIPVARGLGGGSSDAAAAILGILRLAGKRLRLARAFEIAASLGADVPFFLFGGRAVGVNRGDEIYPLSDVNKQAVLVISPQDISVSTRDAYGWVSSDLTKRPNTHNMWGFCALCWSRQVTGVANRFEPPVFGRHPRLAAIRRRLLQQGAVEAALAGSGSAVFGLFRSPAQARRAAQKFPKDQVFAVETLSREEYARFVRVRLNNDGDLVG